MPGTSTLSEYFEEYASRLRTAHAGSSDERIHAAASRYVSQPGIAPHGAGAAVDLTLADVGGREWGLETRMNADPEESVGACYTHAANIGEEARANPQILGAALTAAGLVNYRTEWWHWTGLGFAGARLALGTGGTLGLLGPAPAFGLVVCSTMTMSCASDRLT